jgi:hypothetical protein
MTQCKASRWSILLIPVNFMNQDGFKAFRTSRLGPSFIPRQALVNQKALVGWSIHQGTAFPTGYVIRGSFDHGNLIFGSAVAFMRSCEPLYKFGHARNIRCGRTVFGSNVAIFRVRCQSSTWWPSTNRFALMMATLSSAHSSGTDS